MRVRMERKALPAAAVFALLAGLAQFYAGSALGASLRTNLIASAALGGAAALSVAVRAELKSWWSAALVQACSAFAEMFLLHYALLEGVNLPGAVFVNNYLLSLGILLALAGLTGCPRAVGAAWLVVSFFWGMANCAVVQFRGSMISVGDLFSIGTALGVAGSYRLEILPRMITELCVLAVCMAAVLRCRVERRRVRALWRRTALVMLAAAVVWTPMLRLEDISPRTWGREGAYYNGVVVQLLAEAEDMHVEPPEGYSPQAAAQIAAKWPAQPARADAQRPHVIAIMVEALSDLSVLGEFETSEEVMPMWKALEKESVHGYALASVLGGGTSNSEWEFLTGNSMALMPAGTNAYRQYVRSAPHGLAELFGAAGYTCAAMHPYYPGSWDRSRIYPLMGFDECWFLDDMEWGETLRGRVSDSAFADRVIDRLESCAPGERLFLFGVTMQNHSDYNYPGFEASVRTVGLEGEYPEVDQYLSLVNLTDEAVGRLTDALRGVDEPVALVVFGDHQPELSDAFCAEIGAGSAQDRYKVPWLIWKNYDDEAQEIPLTSLNYLPAIRLESIGAEVPPYFSFLNAARSALPALNSYGCVAGGESLPQDALQGEAADVLADYRILQYANVFDPDAAAFAGPAG